MNGVEPLEGLAESETGDCRSGCVVLVGHAVGQAHRVLGRAALTPARLVDDQPPGNREQPAPAPVQLCRDDIEVAPCAQQSLLDYVLGRLAVPGCERKNIPSQGRAMVGDQFLALRVGQRRGYGIDVRHLLLQSFAGGRLMRTGETYFGAPDFPLTAD